MKFFEIFFGSDKQTVLIYTRRTWMSILSITRLCLWAIDASLCNIPLYTHRYESNIITDMPRKDEYTYTRKIYDKIRIYLMCPYKVHT